MTLTTTRNPRGAVLIRANECQNPRVGSYTGWTSAGAGTGGAATDSFGSANGTLEKVWTTAPSDVNGAGWNYQHNGWSGAYTEKVASADVYVTEFEPKFKLYFNFFNSSGGYISGVEGAIQQLYLSNRQGSNGQVNGWQRVSGTAKSPPGTAYTSIAFVCHAGNKPAVGNAIALRHVLIEPGSTVSGYFDGGTYASGNGTQFTRWEGAVDGSRSLLYDADPITAVAPYLVLGYDVNQASRTVVHQLIDGVVAAAQLPASLRTGTLRLFFLDAISAENARIAHAGAGYWAFLDTDQPQEAMRYVVTGTMRKYQDDSRKRWVLEVPYAEIS